jgi:hypothetical protein
MVSSAEAPVLAALFTARATLRAASEIIGGPFG